jgi:hypothetical protein
VLASVVLPVADAAAHGVCGPRIFASTLIIEDPAVADEASFPTLAWTREGSEDGRNPTLAYDFDFEYSKRITENFGLSVGYGFTIADELSGKNGKGKARFGWHNVEVMAKYARCVDPTQELMLAFGLGREFGRTGTTHVEAAAYGSTTPTLFFGRGLGDVGVDWLRPLAITGTFGYSISDKGLKRLPDDEFNLGAEHRWQGGLALQYSIPYLQSQVRDMGLPEWMGRLTPMLELSWSSPATAPSAQGTKYLLAPGVAYTGGGYQFAISALLPLNRATGSHVGVMAQLHLYFDDLLPNSLGKPLLRW